ncbi:MAG: hypothetical protein ACMUIA_04530 [bacterium]
MASRHEKKESIHKEDILERGSIYFFYRPKVDEESVEGPKEIQRFQFVLSPSGQHIYRLITVGQKQLPRVESTDRYWGYVNLTSSDHNRINEELKEETYRTKTRGERVRPAARPAGEGVYEIVRHNGHTHLVYALELPGKPGHVQQELHIEEEASYLFSVKNPEIPAQTRLGESHRADFPQDLQEKFAHRRWISVDPPEFLNYEGAELLLIGITEDVKGELGLELNPEDESENKADILTDLRLQKAEHPVEPLFKGKWE